MVVRFVVGLLILVVVVAIFGLLAATIARPALREQDEADPAQDDPVHFDL